MLNWANRFNICCFLDNHNYHGRGHTYECLLAVGARQFITSSAGEAFSKLREFSARHSDWLFGHLSYELKNETESVHTSHGDKIGFPDLHFFVPEILLRFDENSITIGSFYDDHENIFREIIQNPVPEFGYASKIDIEPRCSKSEYLHSIRQLQQHILRGDCYEINFCQEFFSPDADINPLKLYLRLQEISPNPFAAFYRLNDRYCICASPERYLQKKGRTLLSQPIKGTAPRKPGDDLEDLKNREHLEQSLKERTENVMIVDLVRNDLSRVCEEGTVKVEELFGVYEFPNVFQMISSITGMLRPEVDWVGAIRSTFPMGSMTGAPKRRVLELIDRYEYSKRGLFSGSIGFVTPERDFDFNVVIRSLFYNQASRYLSYQAGSGITFFSDPEKEYEECLLKVEAIKKALD